MASIESFDDLMAQLETHPEWLHRLRALVLTDELTALPERVAQLAAAQQGMQQVLEQLIGEVRRLAEGQRQLIERVDALAKAQETTEVRLQGLTEQLSIVAARADRAIGFLVEQQYRQKAHAYFQTIATRIRVLSAREIDELLEPAVEEGAITAYEASEVRWSDAVIRARRDGEPHFLVLEASALVEDMDVRRAAYRADVLSRLGAPAIGIAAGDRISPGAAALAREFAVWLVTDGHVEAPPTAA
jgi:vacuolar-type H+-ATPase subunit I/STV1